MYYYGFQPMPELPEDEFEVELWEHDQPAAFHRDPDDEEYEVDDDDEDRSIDNLPFGGGV